MGCKKVNRIVNNVMKDKHSKNSKDYKNKIKEETGIDLDVFNNRNKKRDKCRYLEDGM